MNFQDKPRSQPTESVVPMINVVFLLLIFFLMTAQIAPPEPIEVDLPGSVTEAEVNAPLPLHVGPDGELAYQDVRGREEVLKALEVARIEFCADGGCLGRESPAVALNADKAVPAVEIAKLLPELAKRGFSEVELVAQAKTE